MPVPMLTLNHDGVKLSTTRRQPLWFFSNRECLLIAPLPGVWSAPQGIGIPHMVPGSSGAVAQSLPADGSILTATVTDP